jgi:hypothetical protein
MRRRWGTFDYFSRKKKSFSFFKPNQIYSQVRQQWVCVTFATNVQYGLLQT